MNATCHSPHASSTRPETIAEIVARETGQSPLKCYQCGRCAAGCLQSGTGEMDLSPTRLMRLLQLESAFAHEPAQAAAYAERALSADSPWLCAGCLACTTRCPQGLDIAGMMDVLRQEAIRRGAASRSERARVIRSFHQTFLYNAMNYGRVHELLLVIMHKLRTGQLFQDAMLGPAMFLKGKLHLLPSDRARRPVRVQKAIDQLKQEEGGAGA